MGGATTTEAIDQSVPVTEDQMMSTATYSHMGRYTIGTFVGEEWIYFKRYTERQETCVAREPACVLDISVESFETIRETLLEQGLGKDVSMLET